MTSTHTFEPDWVSPPGATISDLLQERKFSIRDFAEATHRSAHDVARLVNGIEKLTPDWAQLLAETLGASPDFWLRREEQYRKDVERLSLATDIDSAVSWLNELPLNDMIRHGWIDKGSSKTEAVMNSLIFFGVASVDAWRRQYGQEVKAVAYRTSTAHEIRLGAVAAWLRQGEILAQEIDCAPWHPQAFQAVLPKIRGLSKQSDPSKFLPELIKLCADCGVAVVISPLPDGCRASGATKFLTPKKALMLLSFRYLADDQFWFTVFHEAGHLLLHANDAIFLEGIDIIDTDAEKEANDFAAVTLFTETGLAELQTLPLNHFAIARFARRIGIAPGIVVGQLQEMKRIPYKHFNYIKVRYEWDDLQDG